MPGLEPREAIPVHTLPVLGGGVGGCDWSLVSAAKDRHTVAVRAGRVNEMALKLPTHLQGRMVICSRSPPLDQC